MIYSKSIGDLIKEFENSEVNDVKTFNKVFFLSPLLNFDSDLIVEIGEPSNNLNRVISVNDLCFVHDFRPLKSDFFDELNNDENV